ncbi:MAG: penicillin-binding protein 1C [Sphingomonas sp.]
MRLVHVTLAALLLAVMGAGVLDYATLPPTLPAYASVRAAWRPSEAWLNDRHGMLIDSVRVNFTTRRLAWVPLAGMAPTLKSAIIMAEDKRFFQHGGVDFVALASALRAKFSGGHLRGASTITMQLAGFLAPDLANPGARGWHDKLRQMRAAWVLERRWTKPQILEAYLNLAGFRGEAQGVGAASLSLFGKTPEALSPDDARLLAALLPNPQALPSAIAARACAFAKTSDCARLEVASWAMLGPQRRLALDPGLAPHLAQRLLTVPGTTITSTIDARLQRIAATALSRQLQGLGGARARDGAIIVVDNASGGVLAYIGGVGGASTAAQVDGAASYRQAGSTLKPFLYAQALEKGYLTPASILDDSPVQLDTASGLYVPQNYDRDFKGPVSARTALAGSLNVPAVRTLLLVGVEAFRDRLWDSGYRGLSEDGDYYGFSLALGSAEVTLAEQVAAYSALANGGRWRPLRYRLDAPAPPARTITSPQAAWLVGDMLADANARAATFGIDSALSLPFWAAVKTGTSKGLRDNWCIGFSQKFTVGVWVGNLEGDPMRAVSGVSGAAPVWRDVMLALHPDGDSVEPPPPAGIDTRLVRFASALEQPRRDYFLRGTAQSVIAGAPAAARRPRISNPAGGSVYALDPDIPLANQRLIVAVSGNAGAHRLVLDGHDLGDATANPAMLPAPGRHLLALIDSNGGRVDQVRFTVR